MKINVLLVSKLASNIAAMRQIINDSEIVVIGESSGGTQALEKIENVAPDMIVMTVGAGDIDVLSLAERVVLHRPRTHIVLLAEYLDVEILQSANKIGVHNIIAFPKSAKEFGDYIKSVYHNEQLRLHSLSAKQNLSWMSQVVTVFGAKGGLGKTTIATNLAVNLAQKNKKVALIDLDLQFGDAHIFLDIDPSDTIADLVQHVYSPTIDSLRSYMAVHASGLQVLCAPKSPEYAEMVSAEKVQSLLSILRSYYDYVIIDTSPSLNDVIMTAIEASSTILFVTGLDISILKNSKLSMSVLESLQQKDKVRLIVNRAMEVSSIKVEDVQNIIDCPIWARIPSDYKVAVTALNRGVPFVVGAPGTKLAQAITTIADALVDGRKDAMVPGEGKKKKLRAAESPTAKKQFRLFSKQQ